ncbi:MAG: KUP/HAK/KT family potassium transporter [Candidatus Eremiobacteraeota bacterium]|nr:KUP/HAK/KT family potassium transporter [Candidatus Eremiobacteraeota bacterium]
MADPALPDSPRQGVRSALVLAALGVVFGDLGTSPLYTLKTCFTTAQVPPTLPNILGLVSLIIWALVIVVCVKYIGTLMRVDHEGEGGILALLALASPPRAFGMPIRPNWITFVVIVGAGMLFGDGIITPAISVVSAVEGIGVSTSAAQPYVVPISVAILVGLFLLQSRGTERIGRLFGPVLALWFVAIGTAGLVAIIRAPAIAAALDPRHALYFVSHHGIFGFLVFGGVVLAVTGVEALYADMSHFGRKPIVIAWYGLVFPTLILNYAGQGAFLIGNPNGLAISSPFFGLVPGPFLLPMVFLATLATVIASQALISGAFTLTEQAINLNLWPRMTVCHTSLRLRGQVYVPTVNAALGIACIVLVLTFRSSDHLAAAYGLAVSATMLATSIVFYRVAVDVLKWKRAITIPLIVAFAIVDGTFFLSGLPKIVEGAWLPLVISLAFALTAWTWLEGRRCVAKSLSDLQIPLEQYVRDSPPAKEPAKGTMVFLTGDSDGMPFVADSKRGWIRLRAAEENIILLTFIRAAHPYVTRDERVTVDRINTRVHRVKARFGYMESPLMKTVTDACQAKGLRIDSDDTSFLYADPRIEVDRQNPLPAWQRNYFMVLLRNARPLPDDLEIRPNQCVKLGVEVAL